MNGLPELPRVELARFRSLPPGGAPAVEVRVHFNPASLQYTVSNTLKDEGSGGTKKQFVDKTTAKLTMQLVFDTTDTGEDVRVHTDKMASLLKPVAEGQKQVPPNVEFEWGAYRFTGMVEQYKETVDFFAANGVPLRATVDLTLASQDVQFESASDRTASVDRDLTPEPAVVPGAASPSGLANALGDPRAARAIAAANGSASLRFGGGAGLAVGGSVQLGAEAAFSAGGGFGVGGGAGIGIGGGAGIGIGGGAGFGVGGAAGIGGGAGVGAGAGFGAGGSVGIGGGIGVGGAAGLGGAIGVGGVGVAGSAGFGVGPSAGSGVAVGASFSAAAGGAFAGLRATVSSQGSPMPSSSAALARVESARAALAGAEFDFGGRVRTEAGRGLNAEVGADADVAARIRFG